jgi:hypothetical protein
MTFSSYASEKQKLCPVNEKDKVYDFSCCENNKYEFVNQSNKEITGIRINCKTEKQF